jgi:hypothetical protein
MKINSWNEHHLLVVFDSRGKTGVDEIQWRVKSKKVSEAVQKSEHNNNDCT